MSARLEVNAADIRRFFDLLFRYADEGSFISFRCFFDDRDGVDKIRASRLNGSPEATAQEAVAFAQYAASHPSRLCFAPPVATFVNSNGAAEKDLACGVALSVELDKHPAKGRVLLERLLGPATVVVASGGEWTNPETGKVELKLHLHWRLSEPTRTVDDHAKLKQTRRLAARLAGADTTTVPTVHPMRWAGSWHRKGEPRLAVIVAASEEAELDLDDALERLGEAAQGHGINESRANGQDHSQNFDQDSDRAMAKLVQRVQTGEEYHSALRDLAYRYLKAGMAPGQAVETLRGLMDGSTAPRVARWQDRWGQIPMLVGTAEQKLREAEEAELLQKAAEAPREEPKAAPREKVGLDHGMFYGPLGDIVRTLDPMTEASPIGVLASLLTMCGNYLGRDFYIPVGADRHFPILHTLLVGSSSTGRKGTAAGLALMAMKQLDADWAEHNVARALNSGQGIVEAVKRRDTESCSSNSGSDRRMLFLIAEFGDVLIKVGVPATATRSCRCCGMPGTTVTSTIRASPARPGYEGPASGFSG